MELLSDDEHRAILRLFDEARTTPSSRAAFATYIISTLLFFAYGLYRAKVIAMSIAYLAVLGMGVWYHFYAKNFQLRINSALRKLMSDIV